MPLLSPSGAAAIDFHILVVDDDAVEGRLLGDALRDLRPDITIHLVSTPEQAIRFLYRDLEFRACPTPDLVFIDYRMPSNGGRVLSILKGDPDLRIIPVVALSVDASDTDILEIYGRHANCCINKPSVASDLTGDIRTALTFWVDIALMQRNHTRIVNGRTTSSSTRARAGEAGGAREHRDDPAHRCGPQGTRSSESVGGTAGPGEEGTSIAAICDCGGAKEHNVPSHDAVMARPRRSES
jgi:two-component system, chemotaxis family, response regulator Rcp1